MIITCEQCKTAFNLDESLLKPAGSKVRCSKCRYIFTAFPPMPPAEAPAAEPTAEEDIPSSGEGALSFAEEAELGLGGFEEESGEPEGEMEEADLDIGLDIGEDVQGEEDLDLGDLDLDLGGGAEEEAPAEALEEAGAEEDLDLGDLDLDLGGGAEEEAPAEALEEAGAEDELDLGDLDLDLGGEEEKSTTAPAEDEIDISDLEAVLDSEEPESEGDLSDMELDFELEPVEEPADGEADMDLDVGEEEIDLSDIETMLGEEEEEEGAAEMPSQQFDLDMDLDMEEEPEVSSEGGSEEMELDLDTEDLDIDFGEEEVEEVEEIEELEELDASTEEAPATFAETIDMETLEREAAVLEEVGEEAPPLDKKARKRAEKEAKKKAKMEAKEAKKKPPKTKKKTSKAVVVLFLLVVLLGGGYYAVDIMGIRIPYVSDLINPEPEDVNRIDVMQETVRSKFVENDKAGKLFVITGQVRNNHKDARNFISVSGKLFAGGKAVQTKNVFAGNVLTAVQLSDMDMEQISKALGNRAGEKKSNMNVAPNQSLPFMIVFNNLPANLEEFIVEPQTSFPAQ
jgi:predicted Zn finger-like uncharacterized protein